jgi:hypothetical protein
MEPYMRKLLTLWIALAAIVVAVVSPVSAQLGGGLMFPGPGSPASSGGGGRTCTDDTASTNFLTRTGGSAPNYGAGSTRYADAICTFIKALETAGLINGNLSGVGSCGAFTGNAGGFDGLWLIKAHTSANAAFNICGTGFSLVNHSATLTADSGYANPGSGAYVDTQIAPNAGINCLQNSCSVFAGTSTNLVSTTDYGSMMGSGLNIIRLYPHYSNDGFYSAANSGGLTVVTAAPGHFYGVSRTGASSSESYIDTTGTTDTTAAASPPATLFLLADDASGTNPFQGVETFAAVGAGMTPTQEAALQSAYAAYVASVP